MKMRFSNFVFLVLGVPAVVVQSFTQSFDVKGWEHDRTIAAADSFLREEPLTITAYRSPRSAGGIHDFSSEGDYWWPDPQHPEGPYIQRDGMTNPDNFVDHRRVMIRFSEQVATLASAYLLTHDEKYATHALRHLHAWFVADGTGMNPSLLYAQAIKGKATGRGIGIIDTIHLIEAARSFLVLQASPSMNAADAVAIKKWFTDYVQWLTTHPYGLEERDAKNNHGICWVMQVAAFAQVAGDTSVVTFCRKRYKEVLLPAQMALDGGFPLELKRTKPYGYSLFTLDAFATICELLSTKNENLWGFSLPDGRGIRKGMEFLYPCIKDKTTWPYAKDVMHFDDWPVRQPCLLFAGIALGKPEYVELWKSLDPSPRDPEVIRNLPIRHPLLWME